MNSPAPNFLIIGAARAGTTNLARALAQHPDVFVSDPKEPHFLAHAGSPVRYRGPGDEIMINRPLVTEPADYSRLFTGSGKARLVGEGSVSTLYFADRSIPAIERYASADVRLIVMLRQPSQRAFSSYLYLRSLGHEPIEDFTRALEEEDGRREAGFHHMWHYREMSRYADQLPAFRSRFGDRLLPLVFEEYVADPGGNFERVCRFLDIDPSPVELSGRPVNQGGNPRSRTGLRLMNIARKHESVVRILQRTVPSTVRERLRSANLYKPDLDPDVAARLDRAFARDMDAADDLIGRHIDCWR